MWFRTGTRAAWTGRGRMGNWTSSAGARSGSPPCAQYVEDLVSQHCVVIFSKTTCPYCRMAKRVFDELGAAYRVVELDQHSEGQRLQDALAHMTGARTVPRVFVNGKCIGGGSDTRQLHQQGRLLPLVQQCAAEDASGSGFPQASK
ncbi:glutaredoxin 2 isoform 2-T2 [Synchiropus picturatus]